MVRIKLGNVLQEKNKSKYWLVKETHGTFQSLNKLINNQASAIYFDTLETLCIVLDCQPNDIIEIVKEKKTNE